jgi:integrase
VWYQNAKTSITPQLSATQVKTAKSKDREYSLSDGDGLLLRIRPTGSKVWIFKYYHPTTNKRTNMAFGPYPEISLAKAREKRMDARELLAGGISPKQDRDQKNSLKKYEASNTLKLITKEWLKVKRTKVTEDHANDIYRSLEKDIFPRLGETAVGELTAPTVIEVIKPISKRGKHETVKRLCQRLNEVMVFATNTGLIHHNPLSGIKEAFQTPVKKHLPALPPEELPELLNAIENASIKTTTLNLIKWQLHTMTRPGEAAGTKWCEIDFENALWKIPAERMKRKKPHTVVLSQQALSLLKIMKPISKKSAFVFPGNSRTENHMNPSTVNMALKRMGYTNRLVAHGLRSIASTILNEQNFDSDIIEAALSHVSGNEIRNTYNRAEYLERRKVMMQWWSDYIEKSNI